MQPGTLIGIAHLYVDFTHWIGILQLNLKGGMSISIPYD
jgi:hypothetical protein